MRFLRHFSLAFLLGILYNLCMKTTENLLTKQQLNDCSKEQLITICGVFMDQIKELSDQH